MSIYAATYHGEAGYRPVEGYMAEPGSHDALASAAAQGLGEYHIIIDDESMVAGVRVLASGWYDAADDNETPQEFAARLFAEASA